MKDDKVWQVFEVNSALRELIENSLMPLWIRGEVGTLNVHRSGHVYMTLKDQKSQLRAVFFGGAERAREMNLQVGAEVEALGKLTVYEARGEYQLSARVLRPVGFGDLQRRFEELKRKLAAEGLFAPERKKPIPLLPSCIGVVTSPDGAAIRDFLQIINRRFPNIHIMIYPAPVQGIGAEIKLAAGIKFFNRHHKVEVIVLTRGGGSMEDLWPFNEEILARAITDSRIPVISAVGHEIDFTICDFAADLRVPTPSAAAELVIGHREELQNKLKRADKDLRGSLLMLVRELKNRIDAASKSYVFREPLHLVREKQQLVDELSKDISIALERAMTAKKSRCELLGNRLKSISPATILIREKLRMVNLVKNLNSTAAQYSERLAAATGNLEARLNALDPKNVLRRGYSIMVDRETGGTVTSAKQPPGKKLTAVLAKGRLEVVVEKGIPEC
ncbi:MAG: exodeoxyribonuclease VII large subunit [Victivallaceae bacterium]